MARIPDSMIERIKAEVAVERLVESSGIALRKSGKDRIGLCPFHEDAEPSLVVTPAKNLWHCFGCQVGGGPIDWVMRQRGVSFRHAAELLHADPAMAAQQAAIPGKSSRSRILPAPVNFDADDQALLRQTIEYYHASLKQAPEALAYLQARGLDHPELLEHFQLGFANRTLGLRLPEKTRKAGAEIRTRLERIGLYRDSGHEHFNGSIVVPVVGADGAITEVYGRKINDNLRKGTPLHLYLPGPHRGVWNEPALAASKEIILCEALIDAMTFWCAGYRNVTSAYGVEGFTEDHLAAFTAHGVERVLIAYDRDEAGDRAAEKLAGKLMAAGIDCYRILFPKGMDANAYALKVQPAAKSLGVLIRKAQWMGQGSAPEREAAVAIAAPVLPLAALPSAPESPPPAAPLPAAAMPPAPTVQAEAQVGDNEIVLSFGERRYRVRGLPRNLAYEVLKVNVLASKGDAFHVDTLDLYNARARQSYIAQAAIELGEADEVVKTDLGRLLLKLEALQDEQIRAAVQPKVVQRAPMEAAEQAAALQLLQAPDLLERILDDFEACGIVGEATNKLVGYLAATSRRLDAPLAVVIQSSSAAGKSSLMDAVLAMMPEEERIKYSAMTGQSLFYMGETNLKHKILAIVEEEGASRASYALKLLQSEGELTIASTGSDPKTGTLVTQEYRVEGPVMMFLTTTAIDIDEELMNRCLVLSVNEDREQTRAIHRLQREKRTLAGLQRKERKQQVLTLHRNAQRLLRKLAVVNPYAAELTFLDDRTRTRRDHEKYLSLIDTIALLHQYQRPVKVTMAAGQRIEYIEVTLGDIAVANRLAHEVLGRSLDELPPQTRRVLQALHGWVEAEAKARELRRQDLRFSRSHVRQATALSDTQARIHLERLIAMDYVLVHRGTRGQSFEYELLYDGQGEHGGTFVPGLIAPETLQTKTTTATSRGKNDGFAGASRPGCGGDAALSRSVETASAPVTAGETGETIVLTTPTRIKAGAWPASYSQEPVTPLAASA
jgi:DNA primase catalytic core